MIIIRFTRCCFFCCCGHSFLCATVLSDANKRFLYDVGVYDSDDDDDENVKVLC